jgi:outer membrane protein assembly factor BamB/TolA-binding protein
MARLEISPPRSTPRSAVFALTLATFSFLLAPARAQDELGPVTARDQLLDELLERAADKERLGDYEQAVRLYLELEANLEKRRAKNPHDRPTTEVGEGIDRGIGLYLRDRVAQLPAEARKRYRLTIDPRAKLALRRALQSADPEALEAVLARYPLSSVADKGLALLAARALERGELRRALRAFRQLEARARENAAKPVARKAALRRAIVATLRGEGAEASAALASYRELGGEGDPAVAGKPLSKAIAALPTSAQVGATRPSFDLGGPDRPVPLELPELPDAWAAHTVPPAYQAPLAGPGGEWVFVADHKSVRGLKASDLSLSPWLYTVADQSSEPSRLDALPAKPALGGGRVYATLHRNRPAQVTAAEKKNEPATVVRQNDWRVVGLDPETGRLLWDAARLKGFADYTRDAEWISPPLYFEGGVYLTVLIRQNDLRAKLIRLDAATGEVAFDLYLVSRDAYEWRGQASPPPAPSVSPQGDVLVATGLGALAAVDPSSADLAWIARYPTPPRGSQSTWVEEQRRFRPTSILPGDPLVAAPVDSPDLLGVDPATGRTRWRAARAGARFCVARGDEVLLLGDRLTVLERSTGLLLRTGPKLPSEVVAQPLLLGEELVAVTREAILRVSLKDGALLGQWRFGDPAAEVGVPALIGDRLVTFGYEQANVYVPLAERERALAALDETTGVIERGLLFARRGERKRALVYLRKALRSGIMQARAIPVQRAGLELMAEVAFEALERKDSKAFRSAAAQGLAFLGQLALKPELHLGRGHRDLLRSAAPLLQAYADHLSQTGNAKDAAAAAKAYQRLLVAPVGTRVTLRTGAEGEAIPVEASVYARQRLIELVEKRGAKVYASFVAQAKSALGEAISTGDRAALQRVIRRWPASEQAREARWRLAQLYGKGGLVRPAATQLEAFVRDYPKDARRPEAQARLVRLYLETRRNAEARAVLEELAALDPEPQIKGEDDAAPQPFGVWAQPYQSQLYGRLSAEALVAERDRLGLEGSLTEVYRTPTILDLIGPELVDLEAPDGQNGRVLLKQQKTLTLFELPEGRVLLRLDDVQLQRGRKPILTQDSLILPLADRVVAHDLRPNPAQPIRWTQRFALGQGTRIGGDPVHRILSAEGRLFVLTGDNQVAALDQATGDVLWRHALRVKANLGILADADQVVAVSAAPPALEAIATGSGKPLWQGKPNNAKPQERFSAPVWAGIGRLGLVLGGKQVTGWDAATGNELFRVSAGDRWIVNLQGATDGSALVATTQAGARYGLLVVDAKKGVEAWRDSGAGAERNGQPPIQPNGKGRALPADIDNRGVYLGEETVYSVRTLNGQSQVWAQDMAVGKERWRFNLSRGARVFRVIETPTTVLIPNNGMMSLRLQLDVVDWGTGKSSTPAIRLQGRQLRGAMAQVSGGHLILSGEKGVFAFARQDEEALGREAVRLARTLVDQPQDATLRARLANRLDRLGYAEEAVELLSAGMLREQLQGEAFDRLFAQLTRVRERQTDQRTPTLAIRRMARPPEIDGELNDWWQGWTSVDLRSPRYVLPVQQDAGVRPGRWTGEEDLSAKLYLGYDDTYLYFVLDVSDMHMRPYDSEAERWIGDALLIAIDSRNDGGESAHADDILLTLALTLPKKKKEDEDEEEQKKQEEEEAKNRPDGRYFVHRKEDKSGAIYEVAIPWVMLSDKGAQIPAGGPPKGLTFGMNLVLTDDDGERGGKGAPKGAVKTLELTPGLLLHSEKSRLWRGYIPKRFAKVRLE